MRNLQALVLAPTHEIALQSAAVLGQLAAQMPAPGAALGVFIGGLPISEDQKLLRRCLPMPTLHEQNNVQMMCDTYT